MAILATSGTYTYSPSAIQIITSALRIIQVVGEDETPTGAQLSSAMDAMNALCKAWMASGIHVWCEEECILFLQPNQTTYSIGISSTDKATLWQTLINTTLAVAAAPAASSITVTTVTGITSGDNIGIQLDAGTNFWTTVSGAPAGSVVSLADNLPSAAAAGAIVFAYTTPLTRPLRVMGGRRYNYLSRIDLPMNMWARLDYQGQPNKYSTGIPTAFFYDPQTGQGVYQQPTAIMNMWPTPQNNENGMRFTAQRPIQDIATLANQPDFPVEWNAALKWNLALELGPEYGVPLEQMTIIAKQAERWYKMASEWDRESESLIFGVAMTSGQRRG